MCCVCGHVCCDVTVVLFDIADRQRLLEQPVAFVLFFPLTITMTVGPVLIVIIRIVSLQQFAHNTHFLHN